MSKTRNVMAGLVLGCAMAVLPQAAFAQSDEYPFLGTWDCEVATFTFTPQIWNNGSEDFPIQEIQEGSDGSWTILFADDTYFTVSDFTDSTMSWLSGVSGDAFTCNRTAD